MLFEFMILRALKWLGHVRWVLNESCIMNKIVLIDLVGSLSMEHIVSLFMINSYYEAYDWVIVECGLIDKRLR